MCNLRHLWIILCLAFLTSNLPFLGCHRCAVSAVTTDTSPSHLRESDAGTSNSLPPGDTIYPQELKPVSEIEEVHENPVTLSHPNVLASGSPRHLHPVKFRSEDTLDDARAINPNRIAELIPTNRMTSEYLRMYGKTPFYLRAPIYESGQHPTATLEQALRDHGGIYLVSSDAHVMNKYVLSKTFSTTAAEDANGFWTLYGMGPQINHLYKLVKGLPARQPTVRDVSLDRLPHWQNTPIIRYGEADIEKTYKAIQNPEGFLFMMPGARKWKAMKFTLENDRFNYRRVDNRDVESAIRKLLRRTDVSTQAYGPLLASLIHGKPIQRAERTLNRAGSTQVPRFGEQATRQQLVRALQESGKFRYHDATRKRDFEVVLQDNAAVTVRKLSKLDVTTERFMQSIRRLRISK